MSETTAPQSGASTQQGTVAKVTGWLGMTSQGIAIIGIFIATVASVTNLKSATDDNTRDIAKVWSQFEKIDERFNKLESQGAQRHYEIMQTMSGMKEVQARVEERTQYISGYYERAVQDRRNKTR